MAVSLVLNRQTLSTFRAVLNTWAAAINSLLTRMATAESNITALQSSEGRFNYVEISSNSAAGASSNNTIVEVTAATSLIYGLPAPASIQLITGDSFIITNLPSSANDITLTPDMGVTLIGTAAITPGTSALVVLAGATANYIRIY